jgi:hypothetical protein
LKANLLNNYENKLKMRCDDALPEGGEGHALHPGVVHFPASGTLEIDTVKNVTIYPSTVKEIS